MAKAERQFRGTFDRAFQTKLVRLLFQQPATLALVRNTVKFDYFENKLLQWFVGKLYYAYDKRFTPTLLQMKKDVTDAVSYGVIEKEEKEDYLYFAKQLKKKVPEANWIREQVGSFVRKSRLHSGVLRAAVALDEEGDAEKALNELSRTTADVRTDVGNLDPASFDRFTSRLMTKGPKKLARGVPTGFRKFDRNCGGHRGLPPQRLASVMASSGSGKTLILTQFGVEAMRSFATTGQDKFATTGQDKVVLHLTGEDDKEAMFYRYMACALRLPFHVLRNKRHRKRVRRAYKKMSRSYGKRWAERIVIHEFEADDFTVDQIDALLHSLKAMGKEVGLLIVDYADLLKPKKEKEDMYSHLGNVYKELRNLVKRWKIPGWTASQIKTVAQKKQFLDTKDTEGSGKKIFISDCVMMLQQTDKEKSRSKGRMKITKLRFGKFPFEFGVKIDYTRSRIASEEQVDEERE